MARTTTISQQIGCHPNRGRSKRPLLLASARASVERASLIAR
jgi:hypothetical protein